MGVRRAYLRQVFRRQHLKRHHDVSARRTRWYTVSPRVPDRRRHRVGAAADPATGAEPLPMPSLVVTGSGRDDGWGGTMAAAFP